MSAPKNVDRDFVVQLDPVSGSLANLLGSFRLPGLVKRALPGGVIAGMYGIRKADKKEAAEPRIASEQRFRAAY